MPRYSLLARCSVLLLLGFQMLTLLHTYVYSVMMMIVVLLYFFSRSFFSFSPVHSLPFSLTLFFPSECILCVLFHICATKNVRKYLYFVCVCVYAIEIDTNIECVLDTQNTGSFEAHSAYMHFIYYIEFLCMLFGGIDNTRLYTHNCALCAVYCVHSHILNELSTLKQIVILYLVNAKYHCICTDILDS